MVSVFPGRIDLLEVEVSSLQLVADLPCVTNLYWMLILSWFGLGYSS